MPDVLYLLVTVAFFAAVAGFVMLCDRIIGPDSEHGDPHGVGEADPGAVVPQTVVENAVAAEGQR